MRLRTYYEISVLLPLLALGLVAALTRGDADLTAGLLPGTTAQWLYPKAATRGLLAYGVVALWLLRELRRRPVTFESRLWLAPVANAAVNVLLVAPLVLIHGRAGDLLSEHGGRLGLRLIVRLVVGFGYVALVVFAREQLRLGGALEAAEEFGGPAGQAGP
jgi:hypothetical protein